MILSSFTWFYLQYSCDKYKAYISFVLTDDTPKFTLTGGLEGVYCNYTPRKTKF